MAIGPDRVQVLKQESASLGGDAADEVPYTTAIEPLEDAIESAGGYVQAPSEPRDETVGWYRENGELVLFDQQIPAGVTLASISLSDKAILTVSGGFVYESTAKLVVQS